MIFVMNKINLLEVTLPILTQRLKICSEFLTFVIHSLVADVGNAPTEKNHRNQAHRQNRQGGHRGFN